jgi:hypothetical protein
MNQSLLEMSYKEVKERSINLKPWQYGLNIFLNDPIDPEVQAKCFRDLQSPKIKILTLEMSHQGFLNLFEQYKQNQSPKVRQAAIQHASSLVCELKTALNDLTQKMAIG